MSEFHVVDYQQRSVSAIIQMTSFFSSTEELSQLALVFDFSLGAGKLGKDPNRIGIPRFC
jgi:hypothetical protein